MNILFRIAASAARVGRAAACALLAFTGAALAQTAVDPLNSPAWPDLQKRLGLAPLVFDARVEVIAITMGVYLLISVVTSLVMNWYNRRVALQGVRR